MVLQITLACKEGNGIQCSVRMFTAQLDLDIQVQIEANKII